MRLAVEILYPIVWCIVFRIAYSNLRATSDDDNTFAEFVISFVVASFWPAWVAIAPVVGFFKLLTYGVKSEKQLAREHAERNRAKHEAEMQAIAAEIMVENYNPNRRLGPDDADYLTPEERTEQRRRWTEQHNQMRKAGLDDA